MCIVVQSKVTCARILKNFTSLIAKTQLIYSQMKKALNLSCKINLIKGILLELFKMIDDFLGMGAWMFI
jgi:hypothetical protein